MRSLLIIILVLLTIGVASCSYSTDFVVRNDANYPIQVVYKVKPPPHGAPTLTVEPIVVSSANLENSDRGDWKKLPPDRFRIDQARRTVTVSLSAHETLQVTSMPHYIGDEDPNDVSGFPVDELSVAGAAGEMRFTGDKARKAFERKSRVLYVLTYK